MCMPTTFILPLLAVSVASILSVTRVSAQPRTAQPEPASSSIMSFDEYKSSFLLPISIESSRLAQLIDAHAPRTLRGTQSLDIDVVGEERLEYSISRSALSVNAANDRIRLTTSLSGYATAKWCYHVLFGCWNDQKTAFITAQANATFSNIYIGNNWTPHADVALDVNVQSATISIAGFDIDVGGPVQRAIDRELPGLSRDAIALVAALDITPALADAWQAMHQTLPVSTDPDGWLSIQPDSLGISAVTAANDQVNVSIVMSSTMAMHFGTEPETEQRPMNRVPVVPDTVPAFRVRVPVLVSLDDVGAQLNACCSPVVVALGDGQSVSFSDLNLEDQGGRLSLRADFSISGHSTLSGTVRILASPFLDGDVLRLDTLEFVADSASTLAQAAPGVAQPLIIERLRDALLVDLFPYYEDARTRLEASLDYLETGPSVALTLDMDGVTLVSVTAGDGNLVVIAELTGEATIGVGGP